MELKLSGLSLEVSKMVVCFYFMDAYMALKLEKAKNKCKKNVIFFKKDSHWNLVWNNSFSEYQRLFYMYAKMNNQNK